MARPKKKIDKKQFESMCFLQCTQSEICSILDVTDKTLTRWCLETYNISYSETYKKKSDGGKMSLRRYQLDLAKKNTGMAIWLGKQYLGQVDKQEISSTSKLSVEEKLKEITINVIDTKLEE